MGEFPELSLVRLDFSDSIFSVELVQKGTTWPEGLSFCKEVLPATVYAFLEMHAIPLAAVQHLEVVNHADPPMAGCRCYVRMFHEMGFFEMNSTKIETDTQIMEFCKSFIASPDFKLISAVPGPVVREPQVSAVGRRFLDTSFVFSLL